MSTFSWTIELRKSLFFGMLCQRNTRRPTENPDLRTFSTDLNLIVLYNNMQLSATLYMHHMCFENKLVCHFTANHDDFVLWTPSLSVQYDT